MGVLILAGAPFDEPLARVILAGAPFDEPLARVTLAARSPAVFERSPLRLCLI